MKKKLDPYDTIENLTQAFDNLCESYAHILWCLEDALKGFQKLSRKNKSWKSEYEVNAHVLGMIKKIKDALKVVE